MSSNPRSRWANAQEDEAVEAERKRQKEERRQRKAAKARKAEEEEEARRKKHSLGSTEDRPTKRQRRTPEPDLPPAKPLRFEVEGWNKSRSVEHYDKLNDIEEGTYGWVARATELATGKVVALKRLKLEAGDRSGLPVTGLREIQILRDCKHRNIVSMDEVVVGDNVSRLDNSIFLVLEFVEHDLKGILDDMPEPFLSSEVKQLLLQLTSGVAYLHNHWILHRDLKTSNILLNNRGQLKIADFGMARYVGDPPPKLTSLIVTLWYRSPELLLGTKTYGSAVDMWSVGCIFGELLTREPLLQGKNEVDQISKIFELEMLQHEYFHQDPKPKPESLFPTFPSKAGQEKRRRHEPNAPARGQAAASLGEVDLGGLFQRREREERGAGFSLRMV
ncbi:unnamed protein product [Clonostachys rosea f. rosea IK726]|uniref:Uncharacterized protein n=1 Tax=Clonostachys rosea f. rosea IK726 TaxID=1349383 RepID=A0ACA9TMX4_BIOOC|nr:unnamed protein product [Clonostachys rosea f. rosea IK726]